MSSFQKLVEIINKKPQAEDIVQDLKGINAGRSAAGLEIVFQKVIGSHDLTVVKAEKAEDLLSWIKQFQKDKNFSDKIISHDFEIGIANYIKKDIKYFVFDVVQCHHL